MTVQVLSNAFAPVFQRSAGSENRKTASFLGLHELRRFGFRSRGRSCLSELGIFSHGDRAVMASSGPRRKPVRWTCKATVSTIEQSHDSQTITTDGSILLRVGLICGGPSQERGISLNSARSVLDHLQGQDIAISCYYLDTNMQAYAISSTQMYSNTPSDFDYKLCSSAEGFQSLTEFLQHLRGSVDIVFPVLHGKFGEDGGIQSLLESAGIPFVGTSAAAAQLAFDKYTASEELGKLGFATIPSFLIQGTKAGVENELTKWFKDNSLNVKSGRVIVKPARAGSSIGVGVAAGVVAAIGKAEALFDQGVDDRVLIEVFAEGGREFTAIVLDVSNEEFSKPVALMPTEVELRVAANTDVDTDGSIFNYRRKYLPTSQVLYHTPPQFSIKAIEEIRSGAAALFKQLGLRDFARVDGWLLPRSSRIIFDSRGNGKHGKLVGQLEEGTVIFSDINLMSGMEQTSFLFQQAALVGMSHMGILRSIVSQALSRYGLPPLSPKQHEHSSSLSPGMAKTKVFVLFGGDSSERQVSLISGTNVWLNLRGSKDLEVSPFLLTPSMLNRANAKTIGERTVWALPYSLVLRHTVEEIVEGCLEALHSSTAALLSNLRGQVLAELNNRASSKLAMDLEDEKPRELTMNKWIEEAKESNAIVFIAVHGGIGENGILQELLEAAGVPYTGSRGEVSRLCMDKEATGLALSHLCDSGVFTARKQVLDVHKLLDNCSEFGDAKSIMDGIFSLGKMYDDLCQDLQATSICVKPVSDGCSTGVARLCSQEDLVIYMNAVVTRAPRILPGMLTKVHGIIEMPYPPPERLLFEAFIETDDIVIKRNNVAGENVSSTTLSWEGKSRWLEVTVGVIGKKGEMLALNPSITVKESGAILSLEEKFQGGTGVNLTPPPPTLISKEVISSCRKRIELVAKTLKLEGFGRIDAFLHADTGEIIVIEANTIPGMTPSTVLIHQALAETQPIYPKAFFRSVVGLARSG